MAEVHCIYGMKVTGKPVPVSFYMSQGLTIVHSLPFIRSRNRTKTSCKIWFTESICWEIWGEDSSGPWSCKLRITRCQSFIDTTLILTPTSKDKLKVEAKKMPHCCDRAMEHFNDRIDNFYTKVNYTFSGIILRTICSSFWVDVLSMYVYGTRN